MAARLYPVLERPLDGEETVSGHALARVVEAHPALAALMDFSGPDPRQIAVEVGMVYPYEEDAEEDLQGIDFGAREWFEPRAGLAVVRQALGALRDDPRSVSAAIYDPGLRPEDVIADLEAIERVLLLARQHETRFSFALDAGR